MDTGIPFHERYLIEFDQKFITNQEALPIDSILRLFEGNAILNLPLKGQLFIEELFRNMHLEISKHQLDYEVYLQSLLQQLLIYAGRSYNVDLAPKYSQINATHAKVSEIVQYMNQHFQEDLTLVSVSEKYDISHYYLSRLFKNITGFTFIEYLNGIRIKEAQRLLRETKLKVIVIAHQVGFENQSHFGRTFKEFTNQSPLQYRKTIEKL
jgi:transcriptional regulator GlxA family with amidase domain